MTAPDQERGGVAPLAPVPTPDRPAPRRLQIVELLGDLAIALLKAAPEVLEVELERRGYRRSTEGGES